MNNLLISEILTKLATLMNIKKKKNSFECLLNFYILGYITKSNLGETWVKNEKKVNIYIYGTKQLNRMQFFVEGVVVFENQHIVTVRNFTD